MNRDYIQVYRSARYRLNVADGAIRIDCDRRPGCFRRFWYWLLLGWTWQPL
jgi:hypothetical protein